MKKSLIFTSIALVCSMSISASEPVIQSLTPSNALTLNDTPTPYYTEGAITIREVKAEELEELLSRESLNEKLVVDSSTFTLEDTYLTLNHPEGELTINNQMIVDSDNIASSLIQYLGYSKVLKGNLIEKYSNVFFIPDVKHCAIAFAYYVVINSQSGLITSGLMDDYGCCISKINETQSQIIGYIYNLNIENSIWISNSELLIKDYNSQRYYIATVDNSVEEPYNVFDSYDIDIINYEPEY